MSHSCGEHGVNKNLVGDQAGDQSTTVVLVLLLLPVTPCDGIAGQTGIDVLIDHCVTGRLSDVNSGLDGFCNTALGDGVTLGVQNRLLLLTLTGGLVDGVTVLVVLVLVDGVAVCVQLIDFLALLGVEQNVQGLAVTVITGDLGLAADAGEVVILVVGLDLSLQHLLGTAVRGAVLIQILVLLEPLSFPLQMVHCVTAHDQNVRLRLGASVIRVTEHDVNTVHQLHLDLASVGAKSAAVRQSIGVKVEVGGVVTGDRTVEQCFTESVIELELLQQIRGLCICNRGGVMVGVGHVTTVVVSQRFKA